MSLAQEQSEPAVTGEAQEQVDICYLMSHGFCERMVLHSEIIPELHKRSLRVGVISANAAEPQMQEIVKRLGAEAREAPKVSGAFSIQYDRFRRYVFEDVRGNSALWARYLREAQSPESSFLRRWQSRLYLLISRITCTLPVLRKPLKWLEGRMLRSQDAAELLARLKPKMVVATYPIDPMESALLCEARRMGITTLCQLLSWDNISCKGRFPIVPDYFVTWGPIMTAELEEYYGVPAERVSECGVAHFDKHVTLPNPETLAKIIAGYGLDPAKPYIFFGMSSPYFGPREIEIVGWLADRVNENAFGPDMQLVIRPHPQNMQGSMADLNWLPKLDVLPGPRVAVDYPSLESSKLSWSMSESDLPLLVNLLSGCAMCLNSGSTLSIDTIMHDKPVVITSFDADDDLPWWQSARRGPDYPHLAKLIAMGGVRIARSYAELESEIRAYLADPQRDAAGRAASRQQECGPCDGKASLRIAESLARLIEETRVSEPV